MALALQWLTQSFLCCCSCLLRKCIALLKTCFSLFQGQWFSISPHCLQNWGQTALSFKFFHSLTSPSLWILILLHYMCVFSRILVPCMVTLAVTRLLLWDFFVLHSFPHYFYHSSVYFKPKYHPSMVLVSKTTYWDPTKNKQVLLIFCVFMSLNCMCLENGDCFNCISSMILYSLGTKFDLCNSQVYIR